MWPRWLFVCELWEGLCGMWLLWLADGLDEGGGGVDWKEFCVCGFWLEVWTIFLFCYWLGVAVVLPCLIRRGFIFWLWLLLPVTLLLIEPKFFLSATFLIRPLFTATKIFPHFRYHGKGILPFGFEPEILFLQPLQFLLQLINLCLILCTLSLSLLFCLFLITQPLNQQEHLLLRLDRHHR